MTFDPEKSLTNSQAQPPKAQPAKATISPSASSRFGEEALTIPSSSEVPSTAPKLPTPSQVFIGDAAGGTDHPSSSILQSVDSANQSKPDAIRNLQRSTPAAGHASQGNATEASGEIPNVASSSTSQKNIDILSGLKSTTNDAGGSKEFDGASVDPTDMSIAASSTALQVPANYAAILRLAMSLDPDAAAVHPAVYATKAYVRADTEIIQLQHQHEADARRIKELEEALSDRQAQVHAQRLSYTYLKQDYEAEKAQRVDLQEKLETYERYRVYMSERNASQVADLARAQQT
jgi:hypothetical protein